MADHELLSLFMSKNQEKINARQRFLRKQNGDIHTKRYERTKPGFLMRKYHHMRHRVEGRYHVPGAYMWAGKELLPKQEFYDWAMSNPSFHTLWDNWVASGYDIKLCPSVDRIDSSIGYTISNMRFITFHENRLLGALASKAKRDNKKIMNGRIV